MALAFPRQMTAGIDWTTAHFRVEYSQEQSRDGHGQVWVRDLGPARWRASFTSKPMRLLDAQDLHADFCTLRGSLHSFYAHVAERPRPRAHYDGAALGGATIGAVSADRSAVSIAGLPAGYQMSVGDYVTATTSSGVELLRLAESGVANGSGATPQLHITHPARNAITAGNAVALLQPYCLMRLVDGSLDMPLVQGHHYAVTFEAVQDFR